MNESTVDEHKEVDIDLARDVANDPMLLRGIRLAKRESQHRFWARFGVTQTRGSRFESGQRLPPSVLILLRLYLNGVISDGDLWAARRKRRPTGSRPQTLPRLRQANQDRSSRDAVI